MTTERNEKLGVPVYDVLRKFQEALKKCDYKIAHNHHFDSRIVGYELSLTDIEPALFKYKKSICTMHRTTKYVGALNKWGKPGKWPKLEEFKLEELHIKLFGKNFEGAHDALADVKAGARCFLEAKRIGIIKL
jgi:DNA polymerase III epsilon subunit-like protein